MQAYKIRDERGTLYASLHNAPSGATMCEAAAVCARENGCRVLVTYNDRLVLSATPIDKHQAEVVWNVIQGGHDTEGHRGIFTAVSHSPEVSA